MFSLIFVADAENIARNTAVEKKTINYFALLSVFVTFAI